MLLLSAVSLSVLRHVPHCEPVRDEEDGLRCVSVVAMAQLLRACARARVRACECVRSLRLSTIFCAGDWIHLACAFWVDGITFENVRVRACSRCDDSVALSLHPASSVCPLLRACLASSAAWI
jgi:hypothetical protein